MVTRGCPACSTSLHATLPGQRDPATRAPGQFFWVIIGANGVVMARSDPMGAKASCQSAIDAVKAGAAAAPVDDKA